MSRLTVQTPRQRFEGTEIILTLKESQLNNNTWHYTEYGEIKNSLTNPVVINAKLFKYALLILNGLNFDEIESYEICGFGNK